MDKLVRGDRLQLTVNGHLHFPMLKSRGRHKALFVAYKPGTTDQIYVLQDNNTSTGLFFARDWEKDGCQS